MARVYRILFAYDGSPSADEALEGLVRAGLPAAARVRVVSVAEVGFPPGALLPGEADAWYAESLLVFAAQERAARKQISALAEKAARRLKKLFPGWEISPRPVVGEPAEALLAEAAKWKPSLIVLGALGRTSAKRQLLGSVARRVLAHAPCDVRVARKTPGARGAVRVLIAADGSRHAETAALRAAGRAWKTGTRFRVVVASDYRLAFGPQAGTSAPTPKEWKQPALRVAEKTASILRNRGLPVDASVREGDPREEIVKEAARFRADALFVGSHGHGALRRFLMGSTSMSAAERAPCPVEVIKETVEERATAKPRAQKKPPERG